jgi:hypothetical protein
MIKTHKGFLLLNLGSLLALVFLAIYYFIIKNEIGDLYKQIEKQTESLAEIKSKLFLDNSLESDLGLANTENKILLARFKSHINYWENFLNPQDNIYLTHSAQSASGVNAYLNRLLPNLKNRCITNGVKLKSENAGIFGDEATKSKEFGFSFSAYNGYWPSFDKPEASLIEIQAKIVNQVIDALASSTVDGQLLELEYIKREAVGKTDKKYIASDLVGNISNQLLLRSSPLVESYRFQISFIGRTENARSFINQLRPPLSVRKIEAIRTTNFSENTIEDFNSLSTADVGDSDILPIIRDIKTRFIIDLEYVYRVLFQHADFLKWAGFTDTNNNSLREILDTFKTN